MFTALAEGLCSIMNKIALYLSFWNERLCFLKERNAIGRALDWEMDQTKANRRRMPVESVDEVVQPLRSSCEYFKVLSPFLSARDSRVDEGA